MIVIDLGSAIVTYTILIALAILGWARGFRYMLSIAIFITIGYLLTVQGGNFIVGLVNRFYTNGPKLAAFATAPIARAWSARSIRGLVISFRRSLLSAIMWPSATRSAEMASSARFSSASSSSALA